MIYDLLLIMNNTALVSTGIMAGIFFVFSNFAMQSLATLPSLMGIKAMQAINRFILNKLFLSLFALAGILPLFILLLSLYSLFTQGIYPITVIQTLACLIYLFGCFVVTVVRNVPMNNTLASLNTELNDKENNSDVDERKDTAEMYWLFYQTHWARWNHVRAASSILAFVLYSQ